MESILLNSIRKPSWFKIAKMLDCCFKKLSCYLLQLSARFRSLFDNAGLRLSDVVAGRLPVPVSERVALLRYI